MSISAKQDLSILIVGAGPAGLTLACELRRRGVSCRLIDRYSEFPITSRALGIQARTLEVFDDMGVVEPIISQGASVYGVTFLHGERTVATVTLGLDRRARPDQPYRGEHTRVEGRLRQACRGPGFLLASRPYLRSTAGSVPGPGKSSARTRDDRRCAQRRAYGAVATRRTLCEDTHLAIRGAETEPEPVLKDSPTVSTATRTPHSSRCRSYLVSEGREDQGF